jgi:hypothetical protein
VAKLQQLIHEHQCSMIQDLSDEVRIGYGTSQQILSAELDMHHVTTKFVLRILTDHQK